MTDYIPASLRQLISQRASDACEYCLIHQTFSIYRHEVDHVVALKHGANHSFPAKNERGELPSLRQALAGQGLYPDLPHNPSNQ